MATLEQIAARYVQERIGHAEGVRANAVRDLRVYRDTLAGIRSDLSDSLQAAAGLDQADGGGRVATINAAISEIDTLATTRLIDLV